MDCQHDLVGQTIEEVDMNVNTKFHFNKDAVMSLEV